MSTELSWFERNIIPLTKSYKDFIKAKESTPPERWNKDGERKFSSKEKKYLQIFQNRMKKASAAPIVPDVPIIPVAEKKLEVKNPELENQISIDIEKDIVGKITRYDLFGKVAEVKEFISEESYLNAVQEQVGRTNFKNETLLRNPVLLKKVDDILTLDRKSILPLEHYIDMVKNEIKDEIKDMLSQKVPAPEIEIGKITRFDIIGKESETKVYTSTDDYLKALQEQIGRINFKHETLLRDPELLKKVGDLILGPKNPYSLEHYIKIVEKEKAIGHVQYTSAYIQELSTIISDAKREKEEVVGKLSFYDDNGKVGDVAKYTSNESYLQAISSSLDSLPMGSFKWDTIARDPELLKAVDDRVFGEYGEGNSTPLEYYIEKVKNEKIFERYEKVEGSFAKASKEIIDTISSEKLLELKSLKEYNVSNEMRADNFSTIKLLREDIDKINEVLLERSKADKVSIISDAHPAFDALADKLRERYQIEEDPNIPLNSPNAKDFLQQAIEIAKMPDEVQKAALEYINTVAFKNLVAGDEYITTVNSGKIITDDQPEYAEFIEKTDLLEKLLFDNGIKAGKLPKLESTAANYFTVLVGELKRNFSHEIGQIKNTNQFNYHEIPIYIQKNQEQLQHHKDQLKYLGFGEGEKLRKDLKDGIDSHQSNFEIHTVSSKTKLGNTVNFAIKYARLDRGEIFLNSYNGHLTNDKGANILQNFKVTKDNHFSAKEAINLLEGRAVKIGYTNPLTDLREQAFVKLNVSEEKNTSGNYNFQTFSLDYGVNTRQIVEKSNLIFDRPELKENVIKSLEKGDIVSVKMSVENKTIQLSAVLNPQYKTLNLYDSDMNRINTNKPIQGLDNTQVQEKSNVRQQSMSRGI
ncbi:hypothetical protein SD427_18845 (plasmid) [Chryseobacterium sp. JJR-5R]|uniref:hypothetical protein n=1 Tax=Chryseobacterium sp. JJR-5R TaxID=3093923 RepID=UPI002A755F72|nr:hypothetical protein [Chryseobacterium sp. JJR-5R]WPO84658.1 hypothetical protein SD427_18845 [Chryseobacterium sp. JJR-5R]